MRSWINVRPLDGWRYWVILHEDLVETNHIRYGKHRALRFAEKLALAHGIPDSRIYVAAVGSESADR